MMTLKNKLSFCILTLLLIMPFSAGASLLGSGSLNVYWSTPTSGGSPNYYTDYDGKVTSSDFGYTTGMEEIFCVSRDDANSIEPVKFYTITSDLDTLLGAGFYERLSKAAWIADNWTNYIYLGTQDEIKGEAQKAVWEIANVVHRLGTSGVDLKIYNDTVNYFNTHSDDYITHNWVFAYSSGASYNYQDYLTPMTIPNPEPATMFLLGTGLAGLAGFGRKRFLKKR